MNNNTRSGSHSSDNVSRAGASQAPAGKRFKQGHSTSAAHAHFAASDRGSYAKRTPVTTARVPAKRGVATQTSGTRPGVVPTARRSSGYSSGASRQRVSAGRRAPRQKKSIVPKIVGAVVVLFVVLGVAFVIVPTVQNVFFPEEETVQAGVAVTVEIAEGSSGDQIAKALTDAHVLATAKEYYAAVKKLNADSSLQPGTYEFKTLSDAESVVKQLVEGPNASVKLVIPEGLTVSQVASKVSSACGISTEDFLDQAKASNYQDKYSFLSGAANDSLEGFLCPKTYTFPSSGTTADTVITAMLDQFQKEYRSLDFTTAEASIKSRYGVDLNDYQVLTLASIVEREALTEEQRYKVASTFYNRLKQDMALQSDAVMGYVTGGEVTASDLKTESPYNTYLNKGLPPTPICTPSISSLKATLEPADTNYLYFFITSSNEYFSETYDQHLQAIEANK